MNRALFILTIVQSLIASAPAARVWSSEKGRSFYSRHIEITWTVPTNQLPANLRVFKTISARFSPVVISNLVRLGGFTEEDRRDTSYDGRKLSKDFLSYRSRDGRSSVAIAPTHGFAELSNPNWSDFKKPLEKVPDQTRAYELGLELLKELEIPTDSLITGGDGQLKAWFYPGTRGYLDKTKGEFVTEPNVMGVEFRRKVDGIDCIRQYIHMQFENREKLTQLWLHWAGLQPAKTWPVASSAQMVAWIKEGRARVQSLEGPSGARWIYVSDIKKLTVQEASLYYDAGDDDEYAVRYLYPYASLKCEAEMAADDKETIWLFCPVIKDGLNHATKKSDGFSIYPSDLRQKQSGRADGA